MKCGELVTLSAAGKKVQQNGEVLGLFGMIIEIEKSFLHPYKIHWYGKKERINAMLREDCPWLSNNSMMPMKRYEIKIFRGTVCK
jgi:hypothetical protein